MTPRTRNRRRAPNRTACKFTSYHSTDARYTGKRRYLGRYSRKSQWAKTATTQWQSRREKMPRASPLLGFHQLVVPVAARGGINLSRRWDELGSNRGVHLGRPESIPHRWSCIRALTCPLRVRGDPTPRTVQGGLGRTKPSTHTLRPLQGWPRRLLGRND